MIVFIINKDIYFLCRIENSKISISAHGQSCNGATTFRLGKSDLAEVIGGVWRNSCRIAGFGEQDCGPGRKNPGVIQLLCLRTAGVFYRSCTQNITTAMTFEGEKEKKARFTADPERKSRSAIEESQSFWDTMDEYEKASARGYSDRDISFEINNHLYNGAPISKEARKMMEWLDQALQRASLPVDMVLYRGVSPEIWELMKCNYKYTMPGKVFPAEGFISTTYDRTRAWKYASEKAKSADEIAMIEVHARKGTHALSLEAHSYSPEDKEILINRGTKFKVVEARKDGNVMKLIWEVVV